MKKLTFNIQVTKKDIENGIQNCHECPVALAVMRNFKAQDADVDEGQIRIELKRSEIIFNNVPKRVQRFIEKFDSIDNPFDREKLKSFSFKLSI